MKKKVNMILIFLVLGLWGTVSYKYLSRYVPKEVPPSSGDEGVVRNQMVRQKDTFALSLIARDPFLNNEQSASQPVRKYINKPRRVQYQKSPPPVRHIDFPVVQYLGYIKSGNHKKELALLKVNNKFLRLRTGETAEGVKVNKVYKDSVEIFFNGDVRWFTKTP